MTLRTLIVDDEPLARRRIRTLLGAVPDVDVIGECGDGAAAIDAIRTRAPDLVFLDVQMPAPDGFGVVAAVGVERMPVVIFVTAYDQHALRAFEVHALDYLLKPFDRDRFLASVGRARSAVTQARAGRLQRDLRALLDEHGGQHATGRDPLAPVAAIAPSAPLGPSTSVAPLGSIGTSGPLGSIGASGVSASIERIGTSDTIDRLVVRSTGRIAMVRVDEIDWIQAESNYVRLHVEKRSYLLRETISALEARLATSRFRRIHRSTIVNLDRIQELQPSFRGDYIVLLRDGRRLTLSRTYRDRLPELFGRH